MNLAGHRRLMNILPWIQSYRYISETWLLHHIVDPCQNLTSIVTVPEQALDANITRLVAILGNILREVYPAKQVNLKVTEHYMQILETWSSGLPQYLQFQLDFSQGSGTSKLEPNLEIASVCIKSPDCWCVVC